MTKPKSETMEERFEILKKEWEVKGYDLMWEDMLPFIRSENQKSFERGKGEAIQITKRESWVRGWNKEHTAYKCSDGVHQSFWLTVVTSPQWEKWEKEVIRRMHKKPLKGLWDVDECREFGYISPEHFQDFLKFCNTLPMKKGKK